MTTPTAQAPDAPLTLGRFVLLRLLGQGGMGMVYEAYDPHLDRRVALKLVRADRGPHTSQKRDRLLREAQALARLSHPNVVPVHEVGIIDEQIFLVMEYVSGMTLRQWAGVKERSWHEIVAAYCQAGRGLAAAHTAGLVHRDFKPDNVIIGEDERVRVLDFGLARTQKDASPPSTDGSSEGPAAPTRQGGAAFARASSADALIASAQGSNPFAGSTQVDSLFQVTLSMDRTPMDRSLTAAGAVVGTPAYMAPEQFDGIHVGPAADQFSFCLALYEALYSQRPFAATTFAHLQVMIREGAVSPPPQGTKVPSWIFAVLHRGMAAKPTDRHPSMDALLAELSRDRESDLSLARTAATRYMSVFVLISLGIAAWVTGLTPLDPHELVDLNKCLLIALILSTYTIGVVVLRRSLMVNDASRKLMLSLGIMIAAVTVQRFFGWYAEMTIYQGSLAEFVLTASGGALGTVSISRRLLLVTAWSTLTSIAILIWPERLLIVNTCGFIGLLLLLIWVWFGQRELVTSAPAEPTSRLVR